MSSYEPEESLQGIENLDPKLSEWMNEVAEIPHFVNGQWIDVEGGNPDFDTWLTGQSGKENKQAKYADQIAVAKKESKASGLQALKGSTKQKDWAVQIRQKRLSEMKDAQLSEALRSLPELASAHFFIDTKNESASAFSARVSKAVSAIARRDEANRVLNETIGANEKITQKAWGKNVVVTDEDIKANGRFNDAITARQIAEEEIDAAIPKLTPKVSRRPF